MGGSGESELPSIVAFEPEDEARVVSVLADVTVRFDGALDPGSVHADSVRLVDTSDARRIFGSVSWDEETHSITFVPRPGLDRGHWFRLTLSGLRAADGRQLPDQTMRFRTAVNPRVSDAMFVGGTQSWLTIHLTDESGSTLETWSYTDPGSDLVWGTEDDRLDFRTVNVFEGGRRTKTIDYTDPGLDGVWGTADDVPYAYSTVVVGDPVKEIHYRAPGLDGTWFTPDDEVRGYSIGFYDGDGRRLRSGYVDDRGPDGIWQTEDDRSTSTGDRWFYDELGQMVRGEKFEVGPDGMLFTDDDVTTGMTQYVYQEGMHQYTFDVSGPGPDLVWNTDDDVIRLITRSFYDDAGRLVRSVTYGSPGTDGMWRTDDDEVSSYTVYAPLRKNLYQREVRYRGPGADGIWFTNDDQVAETTVYTLDEAGNRVRTDSFNGPGPDGRWFTADDVLSRTVRFDPTK